MLRLVIAFIFLIQFPAIAETLNEKKKELKEIYEAGGITKVEYQKAIEFLEKPEDIKENKEEKKKQSFSLKKKKENKSNFFKKKDKDEEEITLKKIEDLGKPVRFDKSYYPENMQLKFRGHINAFSTQGKTAGQFLFKAFNKSKKYQQQNPGELIKAMAMYEVFYASQLWDAKNSLERYREDKYATGLFSRRKDDEKKIRSLFGIKKGQEGMREALGMNSETPTKEAIKKFWLLGEFLALGTGVENEKLAKDLKKRQELLEEYKLQITSLKKKLQDDMEDEENEVSVE